MATKPTTMERVARAKPYEGRETWHGLFRMYPGGPWNRVVNDAGAPIIYKTPKHARVAAVFAGAAWRLGGPPRAETSPVRQHVRNILNSAVQR